MPIILYHIPPSPPCRAVRMTAEHLGIELVLKNVDLAAGEHMKPEFLAMNPQHCVPTIDDNGFHLWESRAIAAYLVNKYAPDSPLYPRDPTARAVVDKMLNYDLGNLYKAFLDYLVPMILQNRSPEPEKLENIKKSLAILEKILEKTPYAAGNHLTIVDYSILSYLAWPKEVVDYGLADFPNISAWLQRMKKETPKYKEINDEAPILEFMKKMKQKNSEKNQ